MNCALFCNNAPLRTQAFYVRPYNVKLTVLAVLLTFIEKVVQVLVEKKWLLECVRTEKMFP